MLDSVLIISQRLTLTRAGSIDISKVKNFARAELFCATDYSTHKCPLEHLRESEMVIRKQLTSYNIN